jgi:hypothetical protein
MCEITTFYNFFSHSEAAPNMHKLKKRATRLWELGFDDKDIVYELRDLYDINAHNLGY